MDSTRISKMPEAETSLRLAFHLLQNRLADTLEVAIDGAQVRTGNEVHFDIESFLIDTHCNCVAPALDWRGTYSHAPSLGRLTIHSNPGQGDVVATLRNGRTLRVEAKKGPLLPSKSPQEYPLLREALGQLLTIEHIGAQDLLAVAVPHSQKFAELAARWREAPLVKKAGIQILTVSRDNGVHGLDVSRPVG